MKIIPLLMTLVCLSSSCSMYTPGEKKDVATEKTFDLPFETTWARIIAFTSTHGMNVKVIDKSSGLITFEKSYDPQFTSTFLDCGTFAMGAASGYSPLSVNFSVTKPSDKSTTVHVNMFQDALLGNGAFANKAGTCYSKGTFERILFCEIAGTPCTESIPTPTPKKGAVQY